LHSLCYGALAWWRLKRAWFGAQATSVPPADA
jgi:hypothetical protein